MSVNPKAGSERLDLAGLTIVVTRPRAQGAITADLLRRHGAEAVQFPVLDIGALPLGRVDTSAGPDTLARADAIVFVSANAVQFGAPLIVRWGGPASRSKLYAIGQATAQALINRGFANVLTPAFGNDSEALLAMPELQNVSGQNIVLVRGISEGGGRTLLADSLGARGAQVWPLECYQRQSVEPSAAEKSRLTLLLQGGAVHGILVFSVETLDSLVHNIALMPMNRSVALLVSHQRIAAAAAAYGFERIEVVPMGDETLPAALCRLKATLLTGQDH